MKEMGCVYSGRVEEEWGRRGDDVGDFGAYGCMCGGGGIAGGVGGDINGDVLISCSGDLFMSFAPGACGKVIVLWYRRVQYVDRGVH